MNLQSSSGELLPPAVRQDIPMIATSSERTSTDSADEKEDAGEAGEAGEVGEAEGERFGVDESSGAILPIVRRTTVRCFACSGSSTIAGGFTAGLCTRDAQSQSSAAHSGSSPEAISLQKEFASAGMFALHRRIESQLPIPALHAALRSSDSWICSQGPCLRCCMQLPAF
jgi:hypothetical protein